ncbi:acetate--CoA ligase family protein [Nocardioides marmoriginsengisoli]|uniref:acetate--CoA ligase family protein n=1 Tax=Nocardioides marmoriginsengisoli TaxID=661483 RepID=UPI001FE279A3|nr:acetate--CoA ligase family protein [Nocardioides marmoriginsengisoli]
MAVVGASAREGSVGNLVWRNLSSFEGDVVPVNIRGGELEGHHVHRSLREVTGPLDLAVVTVPAEATPGVIADAAAAGVGACIVLSGGFAEAGEHGRVLQEQLVTLARGAGMLLLGPNSLGLQVVGTSLNASLTRESIAVAGGVSLVTQSGSYAMSLPVLSADDGFGFAIGCSIGNRSDIDEAEVLGHLAARSDTRVVCLLLESVGAGEALLEQVRALVPDKPVVVTLLGQSPSGARAAASHSAALATSRRVWEDVLVSAGAIVTRTGLEMLDVAALLDAGPVPGGNRVAVVTNSGGIGTELTDLLQAEGLEVPELSDTLQQRLARDLPSYASPRNPVDITPVWSRFADLYPSLVEDLARSGEVDVVVAVLLQRAADHAVAERLVDTVQTLRRDGVPVTVCVCWVAAQSQRPVAAMLRRADVPVLEWPERTARAIGHAVRFGRLRSAPAVLHPTSAESGADTPPGLGSDPAVDLAFAADQGIPLVPGTLCRDEKAAVEAAADLGYPVVVKLQHHSITHKSDVGGVVPGLRDANEVRAAARRLLGSYQDAQVLIQPMVAGVELLVGGLRDPTFGPVVVVGLGGVLVEILDDVRFAAAPLSEPEARALLRSLDGAAILDGVRGSPGVDVAAVAQLVCRMGDLMVRHRDLDALELNPVLATPAGCVCVDVRVSTATPERPNNRRPFSPPRTEPGKVRCP